MSTAERSLQSSLGGVWIFRACQTALATWFTAHKGELYTISAYMRALSPGRILMASGSMLLHNGTGAANTSHILCRWRFAPRWEPLNCKCRIHVRRHDAMLWYAHLPISQQSRFGFLCYYAHTVLARDLWLGTAPCGAIETIKLYCSAWVMEICSKCRDSSLFLSRATLTHVLTSWSQTTRVHFFLVYNGYEVWKLFFLGIHNQRERMPQVECGSHASRKSNLNN